MAAATQVPVTATPSGSRAITRAFLVAAVGCLAYLALRFWIRDPLSYLLDYSQAHFGDYWPRRGALLLHIAGGTLALFAGPTQFSAALRRSHLAIHRWTGRAYVFGVLIGGAAGFYLSVFTSGHDFGVALFCLALAWWVTTGMAFVAILRRQVTAHREWMTRSYVVTFAFVAFRWMVEWSVWGFLGGSRAATVGWLCWVVPLLATEVALQWRRTIGTARLPFLTS